MTRQGLKPSDGMPSRAEQLQLRTLVLKSYRLHNVQLEWPGLGPTRGSSDRSQDTCEAKISIEDDKALSLLPYCQVLPAVSARQESKK